MRDEDAVPAIDFAACSVPGLPCDAEGPVFCEPGEGVCDGGGTPPRGRLRGDEGAAMLGEEIKAAQRAGDPASGDTYYCHWLATLERMVARKGVADPAALKRL